MCTASLFGGWLDGKDERAVIKGAIAFAVKFALTFSQKVHDRMIDIIGLIELVGKPWKSLHEKSPMVPVVACKGTSRAF